MTDPMAEDNSRKFYKAKVRFILDKYFIDNPLGPDDTDIDMAITDLYLLSEAYTTNKIREARIEGRTDAIRCHSLIEQEWKSYRGSSSFGEVALQTIEEALNHREDSDDDSK